MATDRELISVVKTPDSRYILQFAEKPEKAEPAKQEKGLRFIRRNTQEGVSPYDVVEWERRDAEIKSDTGAAVFRQEGVEIPKSWSQTALNIVASKYFHGGLGTPKRETSVRQLIARVADAIAAWGMRDGYFRSQADADTFHDELVHLLVTQKASFNSPVWFNCGIDEKPQCSACFINSVNDSMESILDLAKIEGMLFKYGSGTGTNLSSLRSSRERLSSGGVASGPVSFMRGFDAFAGVIKSGGKTRRAAKMVILNIDHPDIVEFIHCKGNEEKKAHALIDAGYDGSLNGEAYSSVFFQNANHSVRVSDAFMRAAEKLEPWFTRTVVGGEKMDEYDGRELLRMIAQQAWECGDPGLQFDDTINRWHTCKASGRINSSNPCSEYMFLDDTACNLASLNLLKFVDAHDRFDVESYRHAVDVLITAQEIIVDNASYPRSEIAKNSHLFRPLGLGYANLGALLMYNGLPYDSEAGRAYAAALTAIMHGQAYSTSARIAAEVGPFPSYAPNSASMIDVIRMHRAAVDEIDATHIPEYLSTAARKVWKQAEEFGSEHGFRNAQVTVLAPTGTIGLMMDCDTTGVEPDLALIKFKHMSDGGTMALVNRTVPAALRRLGYHENEIADILAYLEKECTIEGAPHLKDEHLPVFDCAFVPKNGHRSIHFMGHVRMMAAVQPFLSGAISKTVNMPNNVTPEDIEQCYIDAWKMGVKAIAVYRDGCKLVQPLNAGQMGDDKKKKQQVTEPLIAAPVGAQRRRLPEERDALTHKFNVGGHEGYITVGLYEDGTPGEIFLVMAKEGSTVSGLMDSFATAVSLTLQYGVPLKDLCKKFIHTRFEPSGWTNNKHIPHAKSVMDYIFRWLASKFLPLTDQIEMGIVNIEQAPHVESNLIAMPEYKNGHHKEVKEIKASNTLSSVIKEQEDAPSCPDCGLIMVRSGSCYKCLNCGTTSGCS